MEAKPDPQERLAGFRSWVGALLRGQDAVLDAFNSHLLRSEQGLVERGLPRGGFLFVGPTGVGKTELCVLFSGYFYEGKMVRMDMSEYKERGAIMDFADRVVAAAHGGQKVFLFDEIEKAHAEVLDLLLQILSAARLTDRAGQTADLSDCYVIATSNLGAALAMQMRTKNRVSFERTVKYHVAQGFKRPEIIGRFEEAGAILVFDRLGPLEQEQVAKVAVWKMKRRLATLGHTVEMSDEAFRWLLNNGFHPELGARPLQGLLRREVEGAVARVLISGQKSNGLRGLLLVGGEPPGLVLRVETPAAIPIGNAGSVGAAGLD